MREAQQTAGSLSRPACRRRGLGVFLLLCVASATADADSGARNIPILISDHHADHALWLLEQGAGYGDAVSGAVSLIVIDAHADSSVNEEGVRIRDYIQQGYYREADKLFHNHDWIHPLVPRPVDSLVWISRLSGFPDSEKYQGFVRSSAGWNIRERRCITMDELDTVSPGGTTLFVSIDLDFFYNDTATAGDIPFVFDRLLEFSLRWTGKLIWAVCVSRAWLPTIEYAWELLEQSLAWLAGRTEFAPPVVTVFNSTRYDSSRRAAAFRAEGTEAPGLYRQEDKMPERLRLLFEDLGRLPG
jgi:hypothetical protein